MRCILCKLNSDRSRSIEHVIPESLGNKTHVLPPGVVCGGCNNYFAGKIEQRVLGSEYFMALRFAEAIPSKRGRFPNISGVIHPDAPISLTRDRSGMPHLFLSADPAAAARGLHYLTSHKRGLLLFPGTDPKLSDERTFSRLLAKVGLEALALRFMPNDGGLDYIVDEAQLDPVRNYARRGSTVEVWPVSVHRINEANHAFMSPHGAREQVIFEFDFLFTSASELYFVLAVMGLRFVFNLGGNSLEGYNRWCGDNPGKTPLYPNGIPATVAGA